jgi:hypothetical protein
MSRGILIIATNNRHYAKLACNLAASIKAQSDEQITLIHDDAALDSVAFSNLMLFDKHIKVTGNGFALKLSIYDLSPYDKTLFLDADTIFTPKANISQLMDELDGVPFTIANRGQDSGMPSDWINVEQAKEQCKVDTWYNTSSEFIYFEKGYPANSVFDSAKAFYQSNSLVHRTIGGVQPDEPALSFGMAINEVHPHKSPYLPVFWDAQEGYKSEQAIINGYHIMSMGGNVNAERMRSMYKRWADYYCNKLGIQSFPHINKREIKELKRKAI